MSDVYKLVQGLLEKHERPTQEIADLFGYDGRGVRLLWIALNAVDESNRIPKSSLSRGIKKAKLHFSSVRTLISLDVIRRKSKDDDWSLTSAVVRKLAQLAGPTDGGEQSDEAVSTTTASEFPNFERTALAEVPTPALVETVYARFDQMERNIKDANEGCERRIEEARAERDNLVESCKHERETLLAQIEALGRLAEQVSKT